MDSEYVMELVLIEVIDELKMAGQIMESEIRGNSQLLALASRERLESVNKIRGIVEGAVLGGEKSRVLLSLINF